MPQINIYVSDELDARIAKVATEEVRTKAGLCHSLVIKGMDRFYPAAKAEHPARKPGRREGK